MVMLVLLLQLVLPMPHGPNAVCRYVYQNAATNGAEVVEMAFLGVRRVGKGEHDLFNFSVYYPSVGEWEYGSCVDNA